MKNLYHIMRRMGTKRAREVYEDFAENYIKKKGGRVTELTDDCVRGVI